MMIKRGGFSLVELIISVVLLGIIVTFLYSSVANLQKTNQIFASNEHKLSKREKVIELLYDDIFAANKLKIEGLKNSVISMQTNNSLFDITQPNVTWLLSREKNTLLRFESIKAFKEMSSENEDYFHISKVGEDCEIFKIYQSKKKENILIHIQFKEQDPIIYEFYKPLFIKEQNKTKAKAKSTPTKKPPYPKG